MKTDLETKSNIVKRIENLSNNIEGLKITPYKISKNGNFNPRTLNHILSGRIKDPRLSTISKICGGLDISISEFFDDDLFR